MRKFVAKIIKERFFEAHLRWVLRRVRGYRTTLVEARNEIFDRQTAEVSRLILNEFSNTVDVGCHRGKFLRVFQEAAPKGNHFAFEPIPRLAERLCAEFPAARVFNCALSDRAGTAEFFVVPFALAYSSLDRCGTMSKSSSRESIVVRVERLDTLIASSTMIDLLKVDVEGSEGLVFAGAVDTISRCRPVIFFEHFSGASERFGRTSEDVFDLLVEHCGLEISLPRTWMLGGPPLSRRAFAKARDGFYVAHAQRFRTLVSRGLGSPGSLAS